MTETKAFDFQQSAMFNDLKFFFNREGFSFCSLVFQSVNLIADNESRTNFTVTRSTTWPRAQ